MSKEKAVDYFDRHPSSTECHITSDGRVFHTIGSAQGFAAGLKEDKIDSYTRAQLDPTTIPVIDSEEVTPKDDATHTEALKAFDPETTSYEDGKALAQALQLETASNKKVDIFAALELAKANLEPQA